MDEFLKRLEEIRTRAAEIAKMDVIDEAARTELRTLRDERVELEAKIADEELVAELTADAPKPKAEEKTEEEAPAEEKPAEDAPAETPAEDDSAEEEKASEPTAEAIAAAIGSSKPKDDSISGGEQAGLAIVASSASFGLNVGSKLDSGDWQRIFRQAAQQGEGRHVFASIDRGQNDREMVSGRNSAMQNTAIMSQAASKEDAVQRLSAAACYCGPFETNKEIMSLGLDDRPVAGLFRSVPVTGPFKYVRDINLADVAAGVTLWDCTAQEAVDAATPSTWKPCVELDCLPEHEVVPYAIPA